MKPAGAIRIGNYKLIEWYEAALTGKSGAYELYNLVNDISEQRNLYDQLPDKAASLKVALDNWRNKVGAQMPMIRQNPQ